MPEEDCISLVLARQIIALIKDAGVTQMEALSVLNVVSSLMPHVGISVLEPESS